MRADLAGAPSARNAEREADAPLQRQVWSLAWPVIVNLLSEAAVGLVDTLMVGRLGRDAVAAVGVGAQILGSVSVVTMAVGTADLNQDGSHDQRDFIELKERLYRIQDTDGDGIADTSKIMLEGLNADPTYDIAGGLLRNGGDMLIGSAPGVWRLKDDNGDGTIDRQIVISEGYSTHPAFGGHGISGLTTGPDGRIYWEVGDIGLDVTDKSGKRWSYPNQGAIMRSEPDGSNFEVYAAGIRNLQEFSFDEFGNLVSVDNDGDHQGETERVTYVVDGMDSGWRINWQFGKYVDPDNNTYKVWMEESMFKPRFAGQAAWFTPPIAAPFTTPCKGSSPMRRPVVAAARAISGIG